MLFQRSGQLLESFPQLLFGGLQLCKLFLCGSAFGRVCGLSQVWGSVFQRLLLVLQIRLNLGQGLLQRGLFLSQRLRSRGRRCVIQQQNRLLGPDRMRTGSRSIIDDFDLEFHPFSRFDLPVRQRQFPRMSDLRLLQQFTRQGNHPFPQGINFIMHFDRYQPYIVLRSEWQRDDIRGLHRLAERKFAEADFRGGIGTNRQPTARLTPIPQPGFIPQDQFELASRSGYSRPPCRFSVSGEGPRAGLGCCLFGLSVRWLGLVRCGL